MNTKCYTYEGVSYGHPDKIADIIADALVDEFIKQDKNARCGIEVMIKDNNVILGGEVKSKAKVNYDTIVRNIFNEIIFPEDHHLTPSEIVITNLIGLQSEEISKGVDKGENIGAGDQGCVWGFACNDTVEYLPLGSQFAKDLWQEVIKYEGLGPDIKTQVTIQSNLQIKEIVVSTMHQIPYSLVEPTVKEIIMNLITAKYSSHINDGFTIIVNLNGEWRVGGSVSDCGVTGRKLAVDFYGSSCPIGGGNLSGKDLSKVDRSGAYFARYLAKNIVASKLADGCKIHLGYIISQSTPCNIDIELKNGKVEVNRLIKWIEENVNLTVSGMIEKFNNISFKDLSKNGHFGDDNLPWEKLDLVDKLNKHFKGKYYGDLFSL